MKLQKENDELRNDIVILKEDVNNKNVQIEKLEEEVATLHKCKADFYDFCEIERDIAELQQYVRRNNVEIFGISDSINDKHLENKVIEIAKAAQRMTLKHVTSLNNEKTTKARKGQL